MHVIISQSLFVNLLTQRELVLQSRPMSNGRNMCSSLERPSLPVWRKTLMGPPACTHTQFFVRVTHELDLNTYLETNVATNFFSFM
jgi:hypothetical protein